jgi:tetratricopeptide (TPR) repeat protein
MHNKIANQLPILLWKCGQRNKITCLILLLLLLSACAVPEREGSGGDRAVDGSAPNQVEGGEDGAPRAQDLDPDLLFHVLAAERFSADGNFEEAFEHAYEAAILADNPDLARHAVSLAMQLDDWEGVTRSARRWQQLDRTSAAASQLVVLGLMNQGEVAAAARELALQLESAEDPAEAWRDAALLLASADNEQQALAVMDGVVERSEGVDESHILESRSLLLWQLGDQETALDLALTAARDSGDIERLVWAAQLAEASDDLDTAQGLYAEALALDPEDEQLVLSQAEVLRELERLPEAIELLQSFQATTGTLYTLGLYQFEIDDLAGAGATWERLAALEPVDDPDQHAYLTGFLAELLERNDQALRWYGRVAEGPNAERAALRSAGLLGAQGEMAAARELLAGVRASGNEELVEQSWLTEAELLRSADQPNDCVDLLTTVLREAPSSIWLLYSRALCAVDADRLELAEQDLRRIIQIDGDNAMALNALGYTLTDLTPRHSEALRLIERALELQPDDPATLDSMGWVLYRLGRLDEALGYLQRAHAMDDNPEIAAHLAEVMFFLGQQEEALALIEALEQDHPDEGIVIETRERLMRELD